MRVWIEIAIERGMRQRAGYGDFAMRVGGYSMDFLLDVGLSAGGKGKE